MEQYQQVLTVIRNYLISPREEGSYLETAFAISNDEANCQVQVFITKNEKKERAYQVAFPKDAYLEDQFLKPLVLLCAEHGSPTGSSRSINADNSGAIDVKSVFTNSHVLTLQNVEFDVVERLFQTMKEVGHAQYVKALGNETSSEGGFSTGQIIAFILVIGATLLFALAYLYQ